MIAIKFLMQVHVDPEPRDRVYQYMAEIPVLPVEYDGPATIMIAGRAFDVSSMVLKTFDPVVVLWVTPSDDHEFPLVSAATRAAYRSDGWVQVEQV